LTEPDRRRGIAATLASRRIKPEPVEAGSGKQVIAWPVEIDEANKSHLVFWISKEPPYIIKLVNIIPSARRVTVTMSMI
jgi:hypothetical protein